MKKLTATLIAAAMLLPAAPALARDNHDYGHWNHGREVSHVAKEKRFHRGERFDRRYASHYRQISYRDYRGLRAPPRGYHWVQSGNDALLVGVTSGIVSAVVANLFLN